IHGAKRNNLLMRTRLAALPSGIAAAFDGVSNSSLLLFGRAAAATIVAVPIMICLMFVAEQAKRRSVNGPTVVIGRGGPLHVLRSRRSGMVAKTCGAGNWQWGLRNRRQSAQSATRRKCSSQSVEGRRV